MALPRPCSCGATDVRTVMWSSGLGPERVLAPLPSFDFHHPYQSDPTGLPSTVGRLLFPVSVKGIGCDP